jgi:hypothetical protein
MCKTKLLSAVGLAMLLGFSAFAGGQTLVDITGEFKGKRYDCNKNPMDSGVSQSFSTPASGFIRMTTIFYPQAASGLSKGGVLWSADGKNWAGETAMARHYYGGIGTNYWELRNSGKRGPGKKYTEWYIFKINSNSPIKNWRAGIFPHHDPSLDGCTGTQYPSNTRLIIEYSESGFTKPPDETPPATSPQSQTDPGARPTAWRGVFPSQNLRYQYRFEWSGENFTGGYVGIDNPSVFKGRMYSSGGKTLLEFVQTDPRKPSYKATYILTQVAPGKFSGTYTDYTGTHPIELTAETPPLNPTPPEAYPNATGGWTALGAEADGGKHAVNVTTEGERFKASASYTHRGQAFNWVITGTISKTGKVTAKMTHSALKNPVDLEFQLSPDGRTFRGPGGLHWVRNMP